MESLELCENVFANHDTTRLFNYYDKFKYRGVLKVKYIEYFRNAKHSTDFFNCLDKRIYFGYSRTTKHDGTVRESIESDSPGSYDIIQKFISWKENNPDISKEVKIKINFSVITLYFNDFDKVKELNKAINELGYYFTYNYSNIIPDFKKGVVYHKEPKHKFRLFFKSAKFHNDEKAKFINFLNSYDFFLSQSLKSSIDSRIKPKVFKNVLYLYNTHYVDYDDTALLTVIALSYPSIIGKVCTIEKY